MFWQTFDQKNILMATIWSSMILMKFLRKNQLIFLRWPIQLQNISSIQKSSVSMNLLKTTRWQSKNKFKKILSRFNFNFQTVLLFSQREKFEVLQSLQSNQLWTWMPGWDDFANLWLRAIFHGQRKLNKDLRSDWRKMLQESWRKLLQNQWTLRLFSVLWDNKIQHRNSSISSYLVKILSEAWTK